MSLPLDNFDIEVDETLLNNFKVLCADKLNEYTDLSIQEKKIYFDNCNAKLGSILFSFPKFQKTIHGHNKHL